MASPAEIPRVGVGVFVLNANNEFVFGKRLGSHGEGTWALPGGHLEYGETFEECARREVAEETGLSITQPTFLTAVNSVLPQDNKHYVTIFMIASLQNRNDQPQVLEPNKCEGWHWMKWSEMIIWYNEQTADSKHVDPQRVLFVPMMSLVEQRPGLKPLVDS